MNDFRNIPLFLLSLHTCKPKAHTIEAGGDACGQKMHEPMEKTMDRVVDGGAWNWYVSGAAAAGVYVSGGSSAHLRRCLFALSVLNFQSYFGCVTHETLSKRRVMRFFFGGRKTVSVGFSPVALFVII